MDIVEQLRMCGDCICNYAANEIERLRLYERAMQSMAAQFVHPKTTAEELARAQLETRVARDAGGAK